MRTPAPVRRARPAAALAVLALAVGIVVVPTATSRASGPAKAAGSHCSAGAETLSRPGTRVYPDVGNGGYRSIHTDVDLVYRPSTNTFLKGNHVKLTDRATHCLTTFSLDLERKSRANDGGPNLKVTSILVNGKRARFTFVRPTYPGDPKGPNDPNPKAHQASQLNPVGGPHHNKLPPACSPELSSTGDGADSIDGSMCPKNKLVITPKAPIGKGKTFTVVVNYVGHPGVHNDGDGTTEGWFTAKDGSFVTTEPLGTEDWMPLNDYPAAKPTYDFYDTTAKGSTVVCNGELVSTTSHKASKLFPDGSTTFHWHMASPVPSYLVEDSIGDYSISKRVADNGLPYYTVQDTNIPAAERVANAKVIAMQEDITEYESLFNGPFPFASDGVAVGTPGASFEEEMESMITFGSGLTDVDTLYHENMHQWWGDNVTEGSFNMTFFKEGMAVLAEDLYSARTAETAAGGPDSATGQKAFEASLLQSFNTVYDKSGSFWSQAPSKPTAHSLFSEDATYDRPSAAYIALRQILGHHRFVLTLQRIQRVYAGRAITEPELLAQYVKGLPSHSKACVSRMHSFFHQWFDATVKPKITGPGESGQPFYSDGCRS